MNRTIGRLLRRFADRIDPEGITADRLIALTTESVRRERDAAIVHLSRIAADGLIPYALSGVTIEGDLVVKAWGDERSLIHFCYVKGNLVDLSEKVQLVANVANGEVVPDRISAP